jgi:hypothetical protein
MVSKSLANLNRSICSSEGWKALHNVKKWIAQAYGFIHSAGVMTRGK